MDDRYYNETNVLEWAAQGLQKLRVTPKMEEKLYVTNIEDYSAKLPTDFKYLNQIAYKENMYTDVDILAPVNNIEGALTASSSVIFSSGINWRPMRLATSLASVNQNLAKCSHCLHTFTISSSGVINTSLESGCLLVFYKGYPTNEEGDLLIPDSQDLKDALLHWILHNYWLSRYIMKEDGAESRMKEHLQMYSTAAHKCQHLNNPDASQMEVIAGLWNRLVSPTNRFGNLFTTLGNREHVNF